MKSLMSKKRLRKKERKKEERRTKQSLDSPQTIEANKKNRYTPILKYNKLNVFSTSLTYLVKSVSFLAFYLVKSSKSTT